ncbi:MAG: AbrB/MazE/SpoVT family DNA-binding domain-containing protein [Verrucomicrobiota bacterium]
MKATLTSKGQITIPIEIRHRLHLRTGDVLDFDEKAPFLKAIKTITPEAWDKFGSQWQDPWKNQDLSAVLDDLRGPVELPAES